MIGKSKMFENSTSQKALCEQKNGFGRASKANHLLLKNLLHYCEQIITQFQLSLNLNLCCKKQHNFADQTFYLKTLKF